MKNIRRFQRVYFTLLLGTNVFVFSNAINGDIRLAAWHTGIAILATATILILLSFLFRNKEVRRNQRLLLDEDASQNNTSNF